MQRDYGDIAVGENALPAHIAIIMDGNGRWAKKRLLPRKMGHRAGAAALNALTEGMNRAGYPMLTVYAFSTENWKRELGEVSALMDILRDYIRDYISGAKKNNMVMNAIGDLSRLDEDLRRDMARLGEMTARNTGLRVNLAINYGGRDEIVRAARKLAQSGGAFSEGAFAHCLDTAGLPDPDILIRTGGEKRLSNFLLWQAAYAELYFTDTPWPDFKLADLTDIVNNFQSRERRFGARP